MTKSSLVLVFLVLGFISWSQTPPSQDDPLDLDSLFDGEEVVQEDPPSTPSLPQPTVLDRVQQRDPVELTSTFGLVFGYSPGWKDSLSASEYDGLSILTLGSYLGLRLAISPVLTVWTGVSFSYPGYVLDVTQLYADYTFSNGFLLSLGRRTLQWGRSPNFGFGNLLQRQADNPLSPVSTKSLLVSRLSIPIGVGGLDLVIQNKDEYHSNPQSPDPLRLGYGLQYVLAIEKLELDLRVFYQAGMAARLAGSGAIGLNEWLDLYGEGLIAASTLRLDATEIIDPTRPYDPLDFSLAFGSIFTLFDATLTINPEWYYNGEESETIVPGPFPLFWGSNLALNVDFRPKDLGIRAQLGSRWSFSTNTGIVLPGVSFDITRHLTFNLGAGFLFGPSHLGYPQNNPDPSPSNRSAFMTAALALNGRL
ncbi:MAG: hypothetical protein GW949_09955 [Spirochaetales bacterium]|nr:hypothetical protein [Spirochaetales bacterium]